MVVFCPARGDSRLTANQSRLRVLAALGDALIVPLKGGSHEQRGLSSCVSRLGDSTPFRGT